MPILQLGRFIIPRCEYFGEEEEENGVEEVSREDSSPKGADARSSPSTATDDELPTLPQKNKRKTSRETLQQQQ